MTYFCSKCEKQREQGCFLIGCSGIPMAWPQIPPPPPKPEATGESE